MPVTIQIKHSETPAAVPTGLQKGELAITLTNGKLYFGNAAGGVSEFKGSELPTGGTTGQALVKSSATDGAVQWSTIQVLERAIAGVVFTDSTNITATDTILQAFGKLQAQSTLKAPLTAPTLVSVREKAVALGAGTALTLGSGNFFTKTITGNTTLTATGWPTSGDAYVGILELTNGGAGVITYPAGSKFVNATQPVLTVSGKDTLGFYSIDGGTTINWVIIASNVS